MNDDVKILDYETPEQLADFVHLHTAPGNRMLADREIKEYMHYYMLAVSMTRLKLAGILWFDNEVYPYRPDIGVAVTINPNAQLDETSEKTKQFYGMSLSVLSRLASRLAKPEWAETNAVE